MQWWFFIKFFSLFQWNSSMLRRSRRRHYIWRFCSTPTERRNWRIKTKHCGQENFWQKKIFYCNLLTLIRFFNIRVRRKKTKNYYYYQQHDEALKKKETIFFRKSISFCAWWNCLSKILQNLPLFLDN